MKENKEDVQESPKGRSLILAAYKSANPDKTEDPGDEELHDFSNNRYSDLEGKYNELSGANSRLAELISKDPRIGAVLSMISSDKPKSFPYAYSSVFGKDAVGLEGKDLEDYETGYQEYQKTEEKRKADTETANKNFEESIGRLLDYIKKINLDDERGEKLYNGVLDLGQSFLMGIIPNEVFDLVYKGLNYDSDVQEAADTGYVEGKNENIDAKMKQKTEGNPIPSLSGGTGLGMNKKETPVNVDSSYNEFDNVTPVTGSGRRKRLI